MMFDTYKAVQDLKNAGLEEEQAAAFVAVLRWAITGEHTSYAKWFPSSNEVDDSGATERTEESLADAR